jgi:hypothetical protein
MAKSLRHVDCRLEHQDREGYARNPADETEDVEDAEDEEYNATRPVFSGEHVNGRDESENDVEDTRNPDELLRKSPGAPHVGVTEYHSLDIS